MSKQDDKSDLAAAEDTLLKSLESIKSLLEQSETKLTAARESITRANQPRNPDMPAKKNNDEPVVPVLDDIVEPEIDELPVEQDETEEEQLDLIPEVEEETSMETAETDRGVSNMDTEAMLDYIDTLQKTLEKSVRDTLMRTVVNIEKEVKNTISEQLDMVRQQIRDQDSG